MDGKDKVEEKNKNSSLVVTMQNNLSNYLQPLRLIRSQLASGAISEQDYQQKRRLLIDTLTGTTYNGAKNTQISGVVSSGSSSNSTPEPVHVERQGKETVGITAHRNYHYGKGARPPKGQIAFDQLSYEMAKRMHAKDPERGKAFQTWEIFHAAAQNNVKRLEELIEGGVEVDSRDSDNGNTPLIVACSKGQKHAMMYLVEQGADVMAQNFKGTTALHMLVQNKYTNLAIWLVKQGADPYTEDRSNYSPIDMGLPWMQSELKEAWSTRQLIERSRKNQEQPVAPMPNVPKMSTPFSPPNRAPSASTSTASSTITESTYSKPRTPAARVSAASEPVRQEVMKIYLKNNAYKSLLISSDQKAGDVCAMLAEKIGLEKFANSFDLLDCVKQTERRLDPGINVFQVKKSWPVILSSTGNTTEEHCKFKVVPKRGVSDAIQAQYRAAMYGK
mmetsp:Transcript_8681/g.13186  ORF Transcript_8681/g.13186 Transcript_8681/m.13186 type:complete len:446 (+) Transcript_8681:38-1375(+)